MRLYRILIAIGYISIFVLSLLMVCTYRNEQDRLAVLEEKNSRTNELRRSINRLNVQITGLSLLGETVIEWKEGDAEQYRSQRMAIDSVLCVFREVFPAEQAGIDTLREILANKEIRLEELARIHSRQKSLNRSIADIVPVITRQSSRENFQKPKRKGFLGLFGKKVETKPSETTSMLHSLNSDKIERQKKQSQILSEQTDSLAGRNAELNRRLRGLIRHIDRNVQSDLQMQEMETATLRGQAFMQIGWMSGFSLLLLLVLYVIIHRDARRIRRYKRKTAELIEQLRQSVEQNEALIASRKKAVHTITHELRTPLTAITGYAGLMQKSCSADKSTMYVDNIRQSSERMRGMLNTLLDFFRLDNGKEQPNLSPCRISALTHIFETEFMPIAMNKGLTLIVESHTDAVVLTDKERILQIGNNLLSNAVKFTDNGSVSLTVDYDDGLLKLIVEDTGTGMTEDEQRRVFGAFERLSNAATKDGFGLGLSIVQRIVAMLGGIVRLESEKGKGSCFTVEIPMQTAEEQPEQSRQGYVRQNEAYHEVIAIDNDAVLLFMLKEMYAQEGIHCDTCTDAAELIELIRKKEYSLLLTDLNMPDINGFELLELLRTSNVGNSKTIPVVVTTASGSCSKEELMDRGFSGYLLKPFSISELMEVSDKCAMKGNRNEKPDFTSLLSYGNEAVMLEKLIAETEKEMLIIREAEQKTNFQELEALIHHLRSSWEILRADQPLRELYKLLHSECISNDEAIHKAVTAVLDKGSEIIRLAKEERRNYNNG
ncbi:ATP-binding protein [Bacteroides uniformis]|uniref:hybrid sensor histidine kinase/response regulator n=1 Tax=Bacteroides uniformis TaxID=820 RepID=UPI001D08B95A|nr:ATP-binding protein [Bacteroides uniformis]MCB6980018.1 response regulator [Bacteroides uniformis]MCB7028163.1 response regulator [Bacteroides uniformis]